MNLFQLKTEKNKEMELIPLLLAALGKGFTEKEANIGIIGFSECKFRSLLVMC